MKGHQANLQILADSQSVKFASNLLIRAGPTLCATTGPGNKDV